MLELEGVHAGYGQGDVLFGISLTVGQGEVVCLLGRNGAGKSTTLKSIMRLVPPTSGRVVFLGQSLDEIRHFQIARKGIGYVPEDRRIFSELTVRENLEVARKPTSGAPEWTVERVLSLFPALVPLGNRRGGSLSGGEQQMLTIARTLMGNPRLLLLDEPSEGLAPLVVQSLIAQISALKREGLTILLSEQNLGFASGLSDRVYIIDKGQIKFSGTFHELEANPQVKKAHLLVASEAG